MAKSCLGNVQRGWLYLGACGPGGERPVDGTCDGTPRPFSRQFMNYLGEGDDAGPLFYSLVDKNISQDRLGFVVAYGLWHNWSKMDLLGCFYHFYSADKISVIFICVCIGGRHSTVVPAGGGAMPMFGLCCTAVSAAVGAGLK